MTSNSRGDRIQLLQKVLKKHFKPIAPVEGRSVLEQIVFASCLEDAPYDAAEEAFHRVQELYFDWNEIRVTTVTELGDALRGLPNPNSAAQRIKRNLQSIFESRYSFDLEDMCKMNQGKAIQELEKFAGMSRFVLGYVVQHAFGGHTIPISDSINRILVMTGIITQAEADKKQTPGLDRAIPKTKGIEFASCLHQLAVELVVSPQSKNTKAILKEAGAVEPAKVVEVPKPVPPKVEKKPDPKKPLPPSKPEPAKVESKKVDDKKSDGKKVDSKKPELKKTEPKKVEVKKAEPPKVDSKKTEVKKQETKKPVESKPTASKKSLPAKKSSSSAKPISKKPPAKKLTKRKPK